MDSDTHTVHSGTHCPEQMSYKVIRIWGLAERGLRWHLHTSVWHLHVTHMKETEAVNNAQLLSLPPPEVKLPQ